MQSHLVPQLHYDYYPQKQLLKMGSLLGYIWDLPEEGGDCRGEERTTDSEIPHSVPQCRAILSRHRWQSPGCGEQ